MPGPQVMPRSARGCVNEESPLLQWGDGMLTSAAGVPQALLLIPHADGYQLCPVTAVRPGVYEIA